MLRVNVTSWIPRLIRTGWTFLWQEITFHYWNATVYFLRFRGLHLRMKKPTIRSCSDTLFTQQYVRKVCEYKARNVGEDKNNEPVLFLTISFFLSLNIYKWTCSRVHTFCSQHTSGLLDGEYFCSFKSGNTGVKIIFTHMLGGYFYPLEMWQFW